MIKRIGHWTMRTSPASQLFLCKYGRACNCHALCSPKPARQGWRTVTDGSPDCSVMQIPHRISLLLLSLSLTAAHAAPAYPEYRVTVSLRAEDSPALGLAVSERVDAATALAGKTRGIANRKPMSMPLTQKPRPRARRQRRETLARARHRRSRRPCRLRRCSAIHRERGCAHGSGARPLP